ncbi:MAG TPA: DNA gyrase modulator, partial [Anaeromyxobacteraceae bacterium]|nr:DNA gyrase modulator [Anaeromyxobacteraceae bacterium]
MSERNPIEVAQHAVALAGKAGARESAASVTRSREVTVEWRDGRVDRLSESTERGLALELYVDGRYSAVNTSDLRDDALGRFVEDAVALTRALAPDPHRAL